MKYFFSFFLAVLFLSCDKNVSVGGGLTKMPNRILVTTTPPATVQHIVYGNHFQVQNSSVYQSLLETCRRCGAKRFQTDAFGRTTYQRIYAFRSNPKRCESWLKKGYLQITFAENKLPSQASVLIQPQYTVAGSSTFWGEPFELKTTAQPINQNKGFQILINPSDGLGGAHALNVYSDSSNHINNSELHVTVTFGAGRGQSIISKPLAKLSKKAVPVANYDCSTYTN